MALDGLVVIGGDDSNTNVAVLAEYFLGQGASSSKADRCVVWHASLDPQPAVSIRRTPVKAADLCSTSTASGASP